MGKYISHGFWKLGGTMKSRARLPNHFSVLLSPQKKIQSQTEDHYLSPSSSFFFHLNCFKHYNFEKIMVVLYIEMFVRVAQIRRNICFWRSISDWWKFIQLERKLLNLVIISYWGKSYRHNWVSYIAFLTSILITQDLALLLFKAVSSFYSH